MLKNPKISIITACYNSEQTIEDTLKSVSKQAYFNIEYIVIDGKSNDQTLNIIKKYDDSINKIVSEKDKGIFDAFNKGIQIATGDVIGILNSDDFYADEFVIADIAKAFQENDIDSIYGDLVYVDANNTDKVVRYWKSKQYDRQLFRKGWMPPHPTFFCKRQLYERFGNFNLEMKISNDYELLLRFLYKNKASSFYIPRILVNMRTGGNSNGSLKIRQKANQEDRQSWTMNGLKPPLFSIYLKPLKKLRQFYIPQKLKTNR